MGTYIWFKLISALTLLASLTTGRCVEQTDNFLAFAQDRNEVVLADASGTKDAAATVAVAALGPAEAARIREDRQFRHSALQPSGLFARIGSKFHVDVPSGVEGLAVYIVLYGKYGVFPDQPSGQNVETHSLSPGKNTFTANLNGFVHFVDDAVDGSRSTTVNITGGELVPTFRLKEGEWDETQFRQQVCASKVPFGMLVGRRVMVDIQKPILDMWLAKSTSNITERIKIFDDIVDETDRVYGFSQKYDRSDGRYKAAHKVHIVNPDTGYGYASATHDHIDFQVDTGAMADILDAVITDLWGLWHETGHTYQPPVITWSGNIEVTVNVPSLANQIRVNGGRPVSRLDEPGTKADVKKYLELPYEERQFDELTDLWVRLLFFDQLTRGFGPDFYAVLAQQIRVDRQMGVRRPSDMAAQKDLFAKTSAMIVNRDINPWLSSWGFHASSEAEAEIRQHAPLSFNIVNNTDLPTSHPEHVIYYAAPSGTVTAEGKARWGQRLASDGDVKITAEAHEHSQVDQEVVYAQVVGKGAGRAVASFVSSEGAEGAYRDRNTASTVLDVRRGSAAEALGLGDDFVAAIALMPSGIIRAFGASGASHVYFNTRYFAVTVLDDKGHVVKAASITGQQSGEELASAIDGTTCRDNYYLQIEHAEPKNRLHVWSDDHELPQNSSVTQTFKVKDMKLVPSAKRKASMPPNLDLR